MIAQRDLNDESARVRTLRDRLWSHLTAAIPGVALNGHVEHRLPNTVNVRFPSVSGTALLGATPEIAASTGSACHEGGETASGVVLAIGISAAEAVGSGRLKLGRCTTPEVVDRGARALANTWRKLAPE